MNSSLLNFATCIGSAKVNVDMAFYKGTGHAAVGLVGRGASGQLLFAISWCFLFTDQMYCILSHSRFTGALRGQETPPPECAFESDSQLLVRDPQWPSSFTILFRCPHG